MKTLPTLKIVLIEDNFIQRTLIRDFLKIIEGDKCNLEIYTSDNGIEGLGYVFLTKPDIVIIDSTLPDYGGIELVDYLNSNLKKLEDVTFLSIIVLAQNKDAAGLASQFVTFNKEEKDFLAKFIKFLEINIAQVQLRYDKKAQFDSKASSNSLVYSRYKRILFYLSKKVLKWANKSDLAMNQIRSSSFIKKFIYQIKWLFSQVFTNLYLVLFKILKGRTGFKESNIQQEKEDIRKFRIRVYPTLATISVSFVFIFIQVFLLIAGGFAWLGFGSPAKAATITWDGGGTDGTCGGGLGDGEKWSCAANWSGDTLPGALDTVVLDSTSKNSRIDAGFSGTLANININAGYAGEIVLERSLHITGDFVQNNGILFHGAPGGPIDIDGSLDIQNGDFQSSPLGLTVGGNFTVAPANLFTSGGGTVTFDGASAALNCNDAFFTNVVITVQSGYQKTIASSCDLPLGNNPVINGGILLQGTLSGTGTLTTNSSIFIQDGAFSGFSGYVSNTLFNLGNTLNFDLSAYSFLDFNGAFYMSNSSFTSTPGNMNVAGNFTITSGSTFNHSNGTIIFDGGNAIIVCDNTTLNQVTINANALSTKTISSDCNLPLGNAPSIHGGINLNGTLSGTGLFTTDDTFIFTGDNAALSGFSGFRMNNNGGNANPDFSTTANTIVNFGSYNPVDINGNFLIYSGTFTAPSGTMTISKNLYTEPGTFVHNNGTVTFDGTGQTISGETIYYNFNKTVSSTDTVLIAPILTKTIAGTFTLKGAPGAILYVNATADGSFGNGIIDPQGTRDIAYLSVRNNTNINTTVMSTMGLNITDAGNNFGWDFNTPPNAPTGLGPTNLINGNFNATSTPELQFNLDDPNNTDTVKYSIQIDDTADFSSPLVDYTSSLAAQGPRSFVVGQNPGTGSYTTGSQGQTLSQGSYYWRVRTTDPQNSTSAYTVANSGNIAFKIDTIAPTGNIDAGGESTTNTSINLTISATDNLSGLDQMIISENQDFSGATYESYTNTKAFTLSSGSGIKTIYIKFRDIAGNESTVYSDTITLNAPVTPTPTSSPTPSPTNTPEPTRIITQPSPTPTRRLSPTPLTSSTPTTAPSPNITPEVSPTATTIPLPTVTMTPLPTPTEVIIPIITQTTITITPTPTAISQPLVFKAIESLQLQAEESAPEFIKPIIRNVGAVGVTSIIFLALAVNLEALFGFLRLVVLGGLMTPFLTNVFIHKRQKGTIIDEFTKEGIGLVMITVIDDTTGNMVARTISSWSGKYYLKLKPGSYRFELYSAKYISRTIKANIIEGVIFAHVIEMRKDPEKDIAAQLQFRLFNVDPTNIALTSGIFLAMLNAIYMRNLTSMCLLIITILLLVFFKLRSRKKYVVN